MLRIGIPVALPRSLRRVGIAVAVALLSMATGCSRQHATKGFVGGLALTAGGAFVFSSTVEAEGDTVMPQVGVGLVCIGLIAVVAGVMGFASDPEPEVPQPLVASPLPPPPVAGSDALRSQKRVAQFLAERGKCEQVVQISVRVAAADPAFYAATFVTDAGIAKCIARLRP